MPKYQIRIADDELVFSAAHFITFDGNRCERLHGHTYRVSAEVHGPLDDNQYVVDFIAVRSALKIIAAELDHRTLLPERHPAICVVSRAGELEVTFDDRRWVFPADDCLILPIAGTTTELLARYIGQRLQESLPMLAAGGPYSVRIEVSEGTGASATCELP
jgi:6-pyruvoyltetrahydropterin/6-carboxytetrahydropterin synthase